MEAPAPITPQHHYSQGLQLKAEHSSKASKPEQLLYVASTYSSAILWGPAEHAVGLWMWSLSSMFPRTGLERIILPELEEHKKSLSHPFTTRCTCASKISHFKRWKSQKRAFLWLLSWQKIFYTVHFFCKKEKQLTPCVPFHPC